MRIQHNIMAMNSYRNFTNNNKALSKNLEKLSSGYRINRAGDDAAGLAISEKMRAQITGLKAAQKNAKDGISLVQTAEGSLTEVHSMLNRMLDLADQSANGTFDNDVDRKNLQKEFDQLRSEIDRIADSTNFNGIKLLDGSLAGKGSVAGGVDGSAAAFVGGAGALKDGAAVKGTYESTIKFADAAADNVLAAENPDGSVVQLKLTANNGETYTLNFAMKKGNVTAADMTAAIKKQLEEGTSNAEFKALNPDWEKFSSKFTVGVDNATAGSSKLTFTAKEAGANQPAITGIDLSAHALAADGSFATAPTTQAGATAKSIFKDAGSVTGNIATKTAATDAYKYVDFGQNNAQLNGKSVTIGDKTYQFVKANEMDKVEEGNLAVVLGDTKSETMENLVSRLKANGVSTASTFNNGTDTVVRIGNTDEIKVSNKQAVSASSASKGVTLGNDTAVNAKYTVTTAVPAPGDNQSLTFNYTDKDGKAQTYKLDMTATELTAANGGTAVTTAAHSAAALSNIINKDETLKELFSASVDSSNKLVLEAKGDKNGAKLTSLKGENTTTASNANILGATANGDTVSVTDNVASATNINGTTAYGAGQTIELDNNKLKSGDTLEVNGKTYQFLKDTDLANLKDGATAVIIGANSADTAKNLEVALKNDGLTSKNQGNGKLLIENDTEATVSGGLTLQIGDTTDSFNQLTVAIEDMHTKALGLDVASIALQGDAGKAVDAIKTAINSVSSNRGTLGSLQNRLDHTINNLSVMHENIQDAEASIRDVDVAEEMMDYTKNNILVQSAQAMLAQANQVPQGVLQLLG